MTFRCPVSAANRSRFTVAGRVGIYNAMQTVAGKDGKREVVSGTSYLQVVTFDEHGPKAQGLLAFSESSNPQSAHSRDQTEAFSKKQWSTLHSPSSR
ncbi:hypothetical protein F2S71_21025 [Pseudomonas syringae pv. actinidiae]|nr:hypothetical protein [Pseudomonas syringae pv. actinidiae]